jgi:predicted SprT family Zn-dependent metalloprotease
MPDSLQVGLDSFSGDREIALRKYALHYFLWFLPFFRNQPEGSMRFGVDIQLSSRMKSSLGEADLFHGLIRLNSKYFLCNSEMLPYTLFHEMVHLWLYDCERDPAHTRKFYEKMDSFELLGLPIDHKVHIHKRQVNDGQFVYKCAGCQFKWFHRSKAKYAAICGFCEKHQGQKIWVKLVSSPRGDSPRSRGNIAFSK